VHDLVNAMNIKKKICVFGGGVQVSVLLARKASENPNAVFVAAITLPHAE
jgi:ABC-type sugar transport system ATPase subunit